MSGIFGCLHNTPNEQLALMEAAMAHWGPDGGGRWCGDGCGLGQRLLFNTPEARLERLPRWVSEARLALTAEARIDNRDELSDCFGILRAEQPSTPDSELILRAYLKWGESSPDHLLGDWSFAVWHPDERKLFLARDHHGNTSLCYWQQGSQFAFASDPRALYAVGALRRLNELYLAQLLISWFAYHGPQTVDLDIQRLAPAHAMVVSPQSTRVWRYWRLEDTPELRLPTRDDYVQGLLEVYDEAVRCRLRSARPIGVTLSGGLDSGSVTALAARELAKEGKRLTAFTAVPIYDATVGAGPKCFGDEREFAAATAAGFANVSHRLLDSATVTPVEGMARALSVISEPSHAASNFFWIVDLLDHVRAQGCGTLLTGQGGNGTVSWRGAPEIRSPLSAFQHGGWKAGLRFTAPKWMLRRYQRLRTRGQNWSRSAIHPDFATRMKLTDQRIAAIGKDVTLPESWASPRLARYAFIFPGASASGDLWARFGAAYGLEVRDPTMDKRVMAFTIGVPDPVFDAQDGMDRWLLRQAMAGLLPDAVRLNRRTGAQAADLAGRLLASQAEVEAALADVDAPRASAYLDISKMRAVWSDVQQQVTSMSTHLAGALLLRGLMAGLFLNRV